MNEFLNGNRLTLFTTQGKIVEPIPRLFTTAAFCIRSDCKNWMNRPACFLICTSPFPTSSPLHLPFLHPSSTLLQTCFGCFFCFLLSLFPITIRIHSRVRSWLAVASLPLNNTWWGICLVRAEDGDQRIDVSEIASKSHDVSEHIIQPAGLSWKQWHCFYREW